MTLNINNNDRLSGVYTGLSRRWLKVRKSLWHHILRTTRQHSRAVFLVGSGRSGTDIMAHCLSRSMDVKLINETDTLAFKNWRLKDLNTVKQAVTSSGAPVVLLKPIVETMRVKELLDTFHASRALFLIRDYRDAINSMASFFGEKHVRAVTSWIESDFRRFPLVPGDLRSLVGRIWEEDCSVESACGIYWLVYNSSYLFLDLRMDERIRIMNYEMLVMEPENTLRGVCDYLGLQYNNDMIADVYATSVNRRPAPSLQPVLQHYCEETWNHLIKICGST